MDEKSSIDNTGSPIEPVLPDDLGLGEEIFSLTDLLTETMSNLNMPEWLTRSVGFAIALFLLVCLCLLANWIAKKVIVRLLSQLVKRSQSTLDDIFVKKKVLHRLSHLAPAIVLYKLAPAAFGGMENLIPVVQTVAAIYMLVVGLVAIDALFNACLEVYYRFDISYRVPIKGIVQAVKVVLFGVGAIFVISLVIDKNPTVLLGGIGAMTAVLLLIFKDTLLNLTAGIQLATNQMVQRGDWIEMPDFKADGDVIDISLMTVKVQNWDKTVSTIPTYALVSHSFKNWRGMSESGGRRIKRAIYIDMNSIRFCTPEQIERFGRIIHLKDYVQQRTAEITAYNQEHNIDDSEIVNGRRLTNVGTFRAYVVGFLKNHPQVHQQMTFLVRQLAPTENGLPLEIYVFSKDQVWANYEAIQADIFDHLLAVAPQFDLRVFQRPSGADFQSLNPS
jgi:miniconductance mechanosensitive channel